MSEKAVLGIDFGTVNSYFCKCPGEQVSPVGVDFGDGRDGVGTAVLYKDGRAWTVVQAEREYIEAWAAGEHRGLIFRTQFKPDILGTGDAKRWAVDFLAGVLDWCRKQNIDIDPLRRVVIFGVPSEAGKAFHEALASIAREAGYGEVRTVDEPKGALLAHLWRKDISVQAAMRGVLVVDFGGGTCDFAYMLRGAVRHSWGEMELGGRLFDDLFFQWFIEVNPKAMARLKKRGDIGFFIFSTCRKLKETFSWRMAGDRSRSCSSDWVPKCGSIAGMTWEAFLTRAQAYVPSPTLKAWLAEIGRAAGRVTDATGPIDLLAWFRDSLRAGMRDHGIVASDVACVLLTGGSSLWPWVAEVVREELQLTEARLKRSDRPYAVIAQGLSILPALQEKCRQTQTALKAERRVFIDQTLGPIIGGHTHRVAEDIAARIGVELFDERLKPVLLEWRAAGGSVAGLNRQLAQAALAFEPRVKTLVEEESSVLVKGLPLAITEAVTEWFKNHDLAVPERGISTPETRAEGALKTDTDIGGLYDDMLTAVAAVVTGIIALVVASICGGAGIALILSGPIGLLIGLVLGALIAYLAACYGLEQARQMAEKWEGAPRFLRGWALTDGRIAKTRSKLVAEMQSKIEEQMKDVQDDLRRQVETLVEREISNLSEINSIVNA